jgi:predicted DNA-binding transcriptional regulator AlpA
MPAPRGNHAITLAIMERTSEPTDAPPATERRFLTEAETAAYLTMSQKWLQAERLRGGGLRFVKFGRSVRYCANDLEEYIQQSFRASTSDGGPI